MERIRVGNRVVIRESNHILNGCEGIVVEVDHDTNDVDMFYVEVEGIRSWFEKEFLEPVKNYFII